MATPPPFVVPVAATEHDRTSRAIQLIQHLRDSDRNGTTSQALETLAIRQEQIEAQRQQPHVSSSGSNNNNNTNTTAATAATRVLPEDHPHHTTSPPPAYTPPTVPALYSTLGRIMQDNPDMTIHRPPSLRFRDFATLSRDRTVDDLPNDDDDDDDDDDEDDTDDTSPITLRINTSIHVSSNNNLVCVPETSPTTSATRIAAAVMDALKEAADGPGGVPMMDDLGRPRPVLVEIDASCEVKGGGNVVGSEAVVRDMLRQRQVAEALARSQRASAAAAAAANGAGGAAAAVSEVAALEERVAELKLRVRERQRAEAMQRERGLLR